jgi:hypothetical protein
VYVITHTFELSVSSHMHNETSFLAAGSSPCLLIRNDIHHQRLYVSSLVHVRCMSVCCCVRAATQECRAALHCLCCSCSYCCCCKCSYCCCRYTALLLLQPLLLLQLLLPTAAASGCSAVVSSSLSCCQLLSPLSQAGYPISQPHNFSVQL